MQQPDTPQTKGPANPGSNPGATTSSGDTEATLRETQNVLGQMLRVHFSDLTEDPVPDRFLRLLADLERREQSESNGATKPDGTDPPAEC